jgi:hypothetical protein
MGLTQANRYESRSNATLVRTRIGSTVRAADDLDFQPTVSLGDGLRRLIVCRNADKLGRPLKHRGDVPRAAGDSFGGRDE